MFNYNSRKTIGMKVTRSMRHLGLALMVCMISSVSAYGQVCDAKLEVEKQRSSKSVNANGALFSLILTNTSNEAMTFDIVAESSDVKCDPIRMANTGKNVLVDTAVLSSDGKSSLGNVVTLRPGEELSFKVRAMSKDNTSYNVCSCVTVKAISVQCKSAALETVLKVFLPNPSEH